ncbi:MAG: hypothetical protein ABIG60_00810 [Patescibacteria group bacterium]
MFEFIKKTIKSKPVSKEKSEESGEIKNGKEEREKEGIEYNKRLTEEILVHTMPDRFRKSRVVEGKAKNIGLIIVIGGSLAIVVASFLFYYYFIKPPKVKTSAPATENYFSEPNFAPENSAESIYESTKNNERPVSDFGDANEEGQYLNDENENLTEVDNLDEFQDLYEPTYEEFPEFGYEAYEDMFPEPENEATSSPRLPTLAEDMDFDGLNDQEELLLGTNSALADSDNDGYTDLEEIENLYNPNGGNQLIDNSNISQYSNLTFSYQIYYPISWEKISVSGDESILFKSSDNHFIQVIVQPNANEEPIEDWYKEQFSESNISSDRIINQTAWRGVESLDGLNIYITDSEQQYVYVISYSPETADELIYKNIFAMMVKSFGVSNY